MEKVSENPLLFCRNLQANGAQFFGTPCRLQQKGKSIEFILDARKNVKFAL